MELREVFPGYKSCLICIIVLLAIETVNHDRNCPLFIPQSYRALCMQAIPPDNLRSGYFHCISSLLLHNSFLQTRELPPCIDHLSRSGAQAQPSCVFCSGSQEAEIRVFQGWGLFRGSACCRGSFPWAEVPISLLAV